MYSMMWRTWLERCVQSKVAGSSIFCTCMATRRMPPFLAFGSSMKGIVPSWAKAGAGMPAIA
jgi:hypothetical protein